MSSDMFAFAEMKDQTGTYKLVDGFTPFDWQDYGLFGFLADVRNYSESPVICKPRGLPDDVSMAVLDKYTRQSANSHDSSWLSVDELFQYKNTPSFEDMREGGMTTLAEFLGTRFFSDVAKMRTMGVDRVVFWFLG